MIIKRCEHCKKAFQPVADVKPETLCWPCGMDCKAVYEQIVKVFSEEETSRLELSDADVIAKALYVKPLYVTILIRDGWFQKEEAPEETVSSDDKALCKYCRSKLNKHEWDICGACYKGLSTQIIQEQEALRAATPTFVEPTPEMRSSHKSRRYGIGRDL